VLDPVNDEPVRGIRGLDGNAGSIMAPQHDSCLG